jgi:hypothetical protein
VQALAAEVGDYMQVTGSDAEKASEALSRAFNDPLTEGRKFLETIPAVTQAQLDSFDAAQKQGNANAAAAIMIEALDTALGRARQTIDQHNRGVTASITNWLNYGAAAAGGQQADELETATLADQNKQRERQAALIRQATQSLRDTAPSSQQTLQLGVSAAIDEDRTGTAIAKVKGDIDKMNAALEVAKAEGDQVNVDRLQRGLVAAQRELQELSGGNLIAQFRQSLADMQATWTGTRRAMLERSVQMWQQETQAAGLSAKERLQAEKGLAQAKIALNHDVQAENAAIAKSDADTDLAISRLTIDAKKQILDEELQAHQITAARKLEILKQLTADEYKLDLKR